MTNMLVQIEPKRTKHIMRHPKCLIYNRSKNKDLLKLQLLTQVMQMLELF